MKLQKKELYNDLYHVLGLSLEELTNKKVNDFTNCEFNFISHMHRYINNKEEIENQNGSKINYEEEIKENMLISYLQAISFLELEEQSFQITKYLNLIKWGIIIAPIFFVLYISLVFFQILPWYGEILTVISLFTSVFLAYFLYGNQKKDDLSKEIKKNLVLKLQKIQETEHKMIQEKEFSKDIYEKMFSEDNVKYVKKNIQEFLKQYHKSTKLINKGNKVIFKLKLSEKEYNDSQDSREKIINTLTYTPINKVWKEIIKIKKEYYQKISKSKKS